MQKACYNEWDGKREKLGYSDRDVYAAPFISGAFLGAPATTLGSPAVHAHGISHPVLSLFGPSTSSA